MNETLPIYDLDEEIIDSVRENGRLILQAPTGSGKSTQVPQILLDGGALGSGRCIILQPRRLATRMLAKRVAEERGAQLGAEVGYQIRLDNISSPQTRILFVTEGILLRQMLANPRLDGVSTLIFDEFHERHLYSDISLARALDLQESLRPDLKVLVMSATLDSAQLEDHLRPCRTLSSQGRTFPVEIEYLRHESRDEAPWELATDAVAENFDQTEGDILVFMPGSYEIQRTLRELSHRMPSGCLILPLHGELPASEQDKAVARTERRKIIVSTNVAETSLTIDGVTMVVDAGLARVARYDPHRGINTLFIEKVSRASADQRAGRAGRTAPGLCLRLWTQRDHTLRPATEVPEIKRLDLAETVLTLKAAGVGDLNRFRWMDKPEEKSLGRAEQLLADLGALDSHSGAITSLGRRMLSFPIHPRYARMFLAARDFGCVRAAALIAALTQSRNLLLRAERRVEEERAEIFGQGISDFLVLIRAFSYAERHNFRIEALRPLAIHAEAARQVNKLFEQFLGIARAEGLETDTGGATDEAIAQCVLAGFADQVARRRSGGTLSCDIVHGRRGQLARSSVAQDSRLLVAAEITEIEGRGGDAQVVLSLATQIEESWLREMFPHDFEERTAHLFDKAQNRVVVRREKTFRDLVIESQDRDAEPSPEASACLAKAVADGVLTLNQWNDAVEQWIARVNFLAGALPEHQISRIGATEREYIVHLACEDATNYREIKDRPIVALARSLLTITQQQLVDKYAPERLELPGGRRAKITYAEDSTPILSARIQDLYGVADDLRIAGGRIALVIHVLAPNHRPVQVTNSLKTFWVESYPKLKQQLQRQYPKHEWR
ncbi:MAG TPA: ATP-dependent helicase HrpB [Terrimicrobiaceae bacterium]|nr:ATP-dependent helicase HrpB [Terrimicrobiaceae bacterium]